MDATERAASKNSDQLKIELEIGEFRTKVRIIDVESLKERDLLEDYISACLAFALKQYEASLA